MRPEEVEFAEDLPVRATVLNITECPYHWHSVVEIVLVLRGEIEIVMSGASHTLAEGQIAVVNADGGTLAAQIRDEEIPFTDEIKIISPNRKIVNDLVSTG